MTKSRKISGFALGLLIYAGVFLLITAICLGVFWKFMEAYELSRPKTAVNDYLETLTLDQIRSGSEQFLTSLDSNIQTTDQAFAVIEDALSQEITAVRNAKESSSEEQRYMLRCGEQIIGSVTIVPGGQERFGFVPWCVENTTFDFSYLLSEAVSITVPAEFAVSLNGNPLDESYISQSDIPYPVLEEFHEDFEMPTMVTYRAENFVGNLAFSVMDTSGNVVEITPETDMNCFIPCGTEEERTEAEELLRKFLVRFIVFSSSVNRDAPANLGWLNQLLVPRGELSKRLGTALDGLQYVQTLGDEIVSTDIHGIYKVSEERYLCDVSYVLRTIGRKGAVETDHNMKVVMLETNQGLRVEAITRY